MNGSLPPISRLTRATRSAQTRAIRLPVSTEPVNATQAMRSSATSRGADVTGAGDEVDDPVREVVEAAGEREGRQRRDLRRLADGGVARGERRRELPGQEQQRVVPGDDAGHRPDRVLDHQRQLGGLDRGDHAPGRVAADLGVVVERRRGPADLVGVLDPRLADLERHQLGELVGPVAQPGGDLVQQLAPLDRGGALPAALRRGRGRDRGVELLGRGGGDRRDRLLGERVLDRERVALPGDRLAADQQPRLDLSHGPMLARAFKPDDRVRLGHLVRSGCIDGPLRARRAPRRERGGAPRPQPHGAAAGAAGGDPRDPVPVRVPARGPVPAGLGPGDRFRDDGLLRHPAADRGLLDLPDRARRPATGCGSASSTSAGSSRPRTGSRSPGWCCWRRRSAGC